MSTFTHSVEHMRGFWCTNSNKKSSFCTLCDIGFLNCNLVWSLYMLYEQVQVSNTIALLIKQHLLFALSYNVVSVVCFMQKDVFLLTGIVTTTAHKGC